MEKTCWLCKKKIGKDEDCGYDLRFGYFHKKCWTSSVPVIGGLTYPLKNPKFQASMAKFAIYATIMVFLTSMALVCGILISSGRAQDAVLFGVMGLICGGFVTLILYSVYENLKDK